MMRIDREGYRQSMTYAVRRFGKEVRWIMLQLTETFTSMITRGCRT